MVIYWIVFVMTQFFCPGPFCACPCKSERSVSRSCCVSKVAISCLLALLRPVLHFWTSSNPCSTVRQAYACIKKDWFNPYKVLCANERPWWQTPSLVGKELFDSCLCWTIVCSIFCLVLSTWWLWIDSTLYRCCMAGERWQMNSVAGPRPIVLLLYLCS